MVASAWRLCWEVESYAQMTTDDGSPLDLLKDPPIVVRRAVCASVRRWRERMVFEKFQHLGSYDQSHGLCLRPLWAALRHKVADTWTGAHQAALRCAFADRQWPQDRGWAANWATHDRCVLCVEAATGARLASAMPAVPACASSVRAEVPSGDSERIHPARVGAPSGDPAVGVAARPAVARSEAPSGDLGPAPPAAGAGAPSGDPAPNGASPSGSPVPATHEDIVSAPVGTLIHRVCQCPAFQAQRAESQVRTLVEAGGDLDKLPHELQCAFSSGLIPMPRLTLTACESPPVDGSFEWIRWCESEELDHSFTGTVYTDGSRIHDDHPDTRRLGWSFVVLNGAGHVIAAARGSPPAYVHDIPGAEAWAILQASAFALPGCTFWSDCKPCVDALHAGRA